MNAHLKRLIKVFLSPFNRIGLKNKSFSIISNNCWGGYYYDKFHLRYTTPTIGLFFPPKDFLKFVSNIEYYLSFDLKKIDLESANCKQLLVNKEKNGLIKNASDMIIGKLGDIEIVFVHYSSFDDAYVKWNSRKSRINFENLIIKFNDQNEFEEYMFNEFMTIPYKNKLFFTSNMKFKGKENVYFIKKYADLGFALDDIHTRFNIKKYLNDIKRQ